MDGQLMETLALVRFTLSAGMAAALLAGCGGSPPPIGAPGAMPQGHIQRAKSFLYVGNAFGSGSTFVVYLLRGSQPLRQIKRDWNVYAIAIDPWGDVYTTDGMPSGGQIIAYTRGGRSTLLAINDDADSPLAFDGSGNLYVDDQVFIREYKARSTKLLRSFGLDAYNVDALAFDNAGNLYAAQLSRLESGGGKGLVKVYPPGKDQPSRKITKGISAPVAMIFDADGNLYVANCPGCYYGKSRGWVAEYPPGGSAPLRVLKSGIYNPTALALGNNGQLFVANRPSRSGGDSEAGWIAVYRSSGGKPLRRITDGTEGVASMAVDADGYLYAANSWKAKNAILVFTPDGSRLVRKITDGVHTPAAIAITE
jgi:sugar lactone lactonase YvrE